MAGREAEQPSRAAAVGAAGRSGVVKGGVRGGRSLRLQRAGVVPRGHVKSEPPRHRDRVAAAALGAEQQLVRAVVPARLAADGVLREPAAYGARRGQVSDMSGTELPPWRAIRRSTGRPTGWRRSRSSPTRGGPSPTSGEAAWRGRAALRAEAAAGSSAAAEEAAGSAAAAEEAEVVHPRAGGTSAAGLAAACRGSAGRRASARSRPHTQAHAPTPAEERPRRPPPSSRRSRRAARPSPKGKPRRAGRRRPSRAPTGAVGSSRHRLGSSAPPEAGVGKRRLVSALLSGLPSPAPGPTGLRGQRASRRRPSSRA